MKRMRFVLPDYQCVIISAIFGSLITGEDVHFFCSVVEDRITGTFSDEIGGLNHSTHILFKSKHIINDVSQSHATATYICSVIEGTE